MSSSTQQQQQSQQQPQRFPRKRGVDAILTEQGKRLTVGDSCSFRLIKGPAISSTKDPVDAKAPWQAFPLLAKFPESVMKPNFSIRPWQDGRLYQQDVPKPTEDSDEEGAATADAAAKKKRWRYQPKQAARQWVLQEQVDFLETMVARREKRGTAANTISTRYEGLPEHNPSHYALILPDPNEEGCLQVRFLPTPLGTIAFAQPASRKSFTLTQAEQAIQDQRMGLRTTLRHDGNVTTTAPTLRLKPPVSSKSRLEQKLKQKLNHNDQEIDEADDVMGDVTFRNRKGGGGAARRELLTTLGDGVAVSDEGVLGGTNDQVFGGRNRFGQLQIDSLDQDTTAAVEQGRQLERGADGAAMADDFYQRDVQAEYDELDYDAAEQFDDDDVDLGEAEVVVEGAGFGDDDEDEDVDDLDAEEEVIGGAEGLATAAGFRAMLAKARGEVPVTPATLTAMEATTTTDKDDDKVEEGNHMDKILSAAEEASKKIKKTGTTTDEPPKATEIKPTAAAAIQVDENGLRIISLDAVRREIWLNHGSIPMKRLMKIFDVKKKSSQERQNKFLEMVKELCNMKADPVAGRMLVLKQHYSNMG